MLTRLQQGRPEDPQHTQVAVRALINAGYAPHEAGGAFVQYRGRVRAAIAAWPAIAISGFLTAVIPALLLVLIQAAPAALLLCVLGIGLGVIERWRWRRATVHQHFTILPTDQQYLLYQGLLYVVLLVVLALQQIAQAGAVIGLGLVTGLPLSFVYRYYFYRSYPTVLAIVSSAPAGAEARRIVEAGIAAAEGAATQDPSGARPTQRMVSRRATAAGSGRSPMRMAVFLAGVAGWWFLVRWYVWWESGARSVESLVPFSGDIGVDILGIVGGTLVGVGSVWFYERFLAS